MPEKYSMKDSGSFYISFSPYTQDRSAYAIFILPKDSSRADLKHKFSCHTEAPRSDRH